MTSMFFLVGAPRCGTTALSRYLRKHPEICFSVPKESHFLAYAPAAMEPEQFRRTFLDLFFPHRGPEHALLGEGSPTTLYSDDAIRRALALDPEARFIVTVRNPIEMLPSLHLRFLYTLDEDEPDFAKAWRLQSARARGESVPRTCRDPRLLQYAEVGRLAERVERLWELAGRERCLVIVHEDLVAEPAKVYDQVLTFLGVRHDGRTVFKRKLESRRFRSLALHRLLQRPPPLVARAVLRARVKREKGAAKPRIKRARARLLAWNSIPSPPAPLSPALREELRQTFAADVARLGEMLGRDLSHWR